MHDTPSTSDLTFGESLRAADRARKLEHRVGELEKDIEMLKKCIELIMAHLERTAGVKK